MEKRGEEAAEIQFVTFTLAGEEYGQEISKIQEINKVAPITKIPHTPGFICGVMNLRGSIIPIMDMRKRLGLDSAQITKSSRIIVVEIGEYSAGLLVDAVYQVLAVPRSALLPPPPMLQSVEVEFVKAVAKIGEHLVVFLDLEKLISPGEIDGLSQRLREEKPATKT